MLMRGDCIEDREGLWIELINFCGGYGVEFHFRDGGGAVAEGGDDGVVAEVTTTARDDYEIIDLELF